MSIADKIFIDARQEAAVHHAGITTAFLTLQEAVIGWYAFSEVERDNATISVKGGRVYKRHEIERFHYAG